jgi:hypothetical protein
MKDLNDPSKKKMKDLNVKLEEIRLVQLIPNLMILSRK